MDFLQMKIGHKHIQSFDLLSIKVFKYFKILQNTFIDRKTYV